MVKWLNHVAIAAPRNGTTSHTVSPSSGTAVAGSLFTPTAGRFLVCVVEGAVTSSTPSGWTLPTGGSAVANTGLYLWYRTAAGSDSLTTTHNGSNYPVVFDFYEFPSATSFISSAAANGVSGNGGAGPSLSGLTASATFRAGAVGQNRSSATTATFTWSAGTEATDTSVGQSGTDGYGFSLVYIEDQTGATYSVAATSTDTATTCERLVFALNVPAGTPSGSSAETIDLADLASGTRISNGASAETINLADLAAGTRASSGTVADAVAVADVASGVRTPVGNAGDSVAVIDAAFGIAPVIQQEGTAAETINLADAAAGTIVVSGTSAETITLADTASGQMPVVGQNEGSAAETLVLNDAVAGTRASLGNSVDSLNFSDSAIGVTIHRGTIAENALIGEIANGQVLMTGIAHDSAVLGDAASGSMPARGSAAEVIDLEDRADSQTTPTFAIGPDAAEIFIGAEAVDKVYLGATLIYDAAG